MVLGTFDSAAWEVKGTNWLVILIMIGLDMYVGKCIANKFGKSDAFGIGLGILPIIFAPILAFGKAEFQEKEYI